MSEVAAFKALFDWYYSPGEVIRSIGFYMNPYHQWEHSKFRHIFCFDDKLNLYIGQYSVYQQHFEQIFNLKKKTKYEYGFIYPVAAYCTPAYTETEVSEFNSKVQNMSQYVPLVEFKDLNTINISEFNKRLKRISQRLYDYGMPEKTTFIADKVDLWFPTIRGVLAGKYMKKLDAAYLKNQINLMLHTEGRFLDAGGLVTEDYSSSVKNKPGRNKL